MDYVDWCDRLAIAIADQARDAYGNYVNLHILAGEFLESNGLIGTRAEDGAILSAIEILKVCGVDGRGPMIRIGYSAQDKLRDSYMRWKQAASIIVSGDSRILLRTLNQLSPLEESGIPRLEEVEIEILLKEVAKEIEGEPLNGGYAAEKLDELEAFGLVRSHKLIGAQYYKSTYLGIACLSREFVSLDGDIDELRSAGEGDTIDYKRRYDLKSDSDKFTFAKDVTSLANAGGMGSRYILIGIEDDGRFYAAPDQGAEGDHRQALDRLEETRLQQIVSSRSIPTPSFRAVRGNHRDGPYVLVEITPDPAARPYRIFKDPKDKNAPNALELGQVWLRKGSTNAEATQTEIDLLGKQAALYQDIRAMKK